MTVLFEWDSKEGKYLEVVCMNPHTKNWHTILRISWTGEAFSVKTAVGEHPAQFTITDLRQKKQMFCEYVLTYYHS